MSVKFNEKVANDKGPLDCVIVIQMGYQCACFEGFGW